MQIYLPKIIYSSPTNLPIPEKLILYYIVHKAFESTAITSDNLDLQIDLKELYAIFNNSSVDFTDIKSQMNSAINNLTKINMSLVDNGFHIKLAPISSVYLDKFSSKLYVVVNPIIIKYLDQVFTGNYVTLDLYKDCR